MAVSGIIFCGEMLWKYWASVERNEYCRLVFGVFFITSTSSL